MTPKQIQDACKQKSHHYIVNAFHQLNFGSNKYSIHLATPGECLHMHQLGAAKRCVEAFALLLTGKVHDLFGKLSRNHGANLSRQSDREFPRTKFSSILTTTKKEGHDYAGMLISILIAIVSPTGTQILCEQANLTNEFINQQVHVIELILSMEEFLKHGKMKYGELKHLDKTIVHFINCINSTCKRGGMGTRLIKNHLYFHLKQYIEYWGPPKGFDSAPSESNHKTEIKAPSKNTQCNSQSLIEQTANRQTEYGQILRAMNHFQIHQEQTQTPIIRNKYSGAKFKIMKDSNGLPTMTWIHSRNKQNTSFPPQVLRYCCENVLSIQKYKSHIDGFTEHNRYDPLTKQNYLFRCHPSYRSDSLQVGDEWMDWAIFDIDEMEIPCQILCFIHVGDLDVVRQHYVGGYEVTSGPHAVVRRFTSEPSIIAFPSTEFIQRGSFLDELYLYSIDSIVSNVAVVPELDANLNPTNCWLYIQNRKQWLDCFYIQNKSMSRKTLHSLYDEHDMSSESESESESEPTNDSGDTSDSDETSDSTSE